jgi:hypothetical protein
MKATLFFLLLAASAVSMAEERPGKAVYEISSELGMKLTDRALKNIEVQTKKLPDGGALVAPTSSLVYFQDQVGV